MILVTGATGNVGSELVTQLMERGHSVRALTRRGGGKLPTTVETVTGDLNDPAALTDAFRGVSGVFLLGGYRDMPGVLKEISDAGVERVVLLTSRSVEGGNPSNAIVSMWLESEAAVRASSVNWTILHPGGFMSNALRWAPQIISGGLVRVAFGDVPVAVIDPYDLAAVACEALVTDEHSFRTYPISGPESMTPRDQVAILSKVLGRDIAFESQPNDEARAEMAKSMPAPMVDAFVRFFADGEFDDTAVAPTVREVTGRDPRSFEEWARLHASSFR